MWGREEKIGPKNLALAPVSHTQSNHKPCQSPIQTWFHSGTILRFIWGIQGVFCWPRVAEGGDSCEKLVIRSRRKVSGPKKKKKVIPAFRTAQEFAFFLSLMPVTQELTIFQVLELGEGD